MTPLHYAVITNKPLNVKLLCNNGKIDVNITNSSGFTPLYFAARQGYSYCLQHLLTHPNIDINK